jgi:hypothetical protein
MMEMKRFITAVLLFAGIIMLYSGCKTKSKLIKTTSVSDHSHSIIADSSITAVQKISTKSTIDTGRKESVEVTDRTTKRTIDITVDLDSNQKLKPDSAGNINVKDLVNTALSNAKSLRIKIQEEIQERNSKKNQEQKGAAAHESAAEKLSVGNYHIQDKQLAIDSLSSQTSKSKDNTPAALGFDWWWVVKGFILLSIVAFIILKFKKS